MIGVNMTHGYLVGLTDYGSAVGSKNIFSGGSLSFIEPEAKEKLMTHELVNEANTARK